MIELKKKKFPCSNDTIIVLHLQFTELCAKWVNLKGTNTDNFEKMKLQLTKLMNDRAYLNENLQLHKWRAREREPIMLFWRFLASNGFYGKAPGWGSGAKPPESDQI